MWRQQSGSVLCPSCGQLVGVNDAQCLSCGRRYPGMWGFAFLLRNTGTDMGFTMLVMWACGALFISSLVMDMQSVGMHGLLGMLSPSLPSVIMLGASGALPVFRLGRWWTVLSASWLHGGLLHIVFNMMSVRDLLPVVAHLYGAARTVVIYVLAGIAGFAASSFVAQYAPPFMPRVLRGAGFTLGASASIFGLIGALAYYGRRSGSAHISDAAKRMMMGGLLFGFMMPGVDNWAHLGGFAGGYLVGRFLDPLLPERGDHFLAAGVCLAASAAAVIASVVTGIALFQRP